MLIKLLGKQIRDRIEIARETNLYLADREARLRAPRNPAVSPQNQWTALRAANEKVGQIGKSQILECLYRTARTYFLQNG